MADQHISQFEEEMGSAPVVSASSFGKSMVIAPHPDDETLGCGGTAALLLDMGHKVHFLFLSDGTLSHPNSARYPAPRLRELREKEAAAAVQILGGNLQDIGFLALPDRRVPDQNSPYFETIVRLVMSLIERIGPKTLFFPWQNDPHPDHRATYQIVTEAVSRIEEKPRLLQYPIWLWEMGNADDIALIRRLKICSVDISKVAARKQDALQAHESQVTDLIDDDPEGFRLSQEMISHFSHTKEIFFE